MLSRRIWMVGLLSLVLALMPELSLAAEHGGMDSMKEHGGKEHGGTTSTDAATPGAGGDTAPTTTAPAPEQGGATVVPAPTPANVVPAAPPAPPALKPIVITFSGDLAAVDAAATPAVITVQDRYGVKKEIAVPAEAKIAQGTAAKALADLKVGDKLTVEYTYDVATGKRTAQSITVGEAAPSAS